MAADGAYPSVAGIGARSDRALATPARGSAVRAFALGMAPIAAAGATYELLRPVFRYRGEVHTGDLYALERTLFPLSTAEGTVALSEALANAVNPVFDVIAGATYVLFVLELVALAAYLFFRDQRKMLELTLGFYLVNLAGWALWFVVPAAPPWYVDLYGMGPALLDAPSSAAGLVRLDELLGVPLTETFYSKSANVFGAVPSLHVAYAALAALVAFSLGGAVRWATTAFAVSMAFSAVYLRHHYLLDVAAGGALALGVASLMRRVLGGARKSTEVPA